MPNFNETLESMRSLGMKAPSERVHIQIPEAEAILHNAMRYFLSFQGIEYKPQPEYIQVAEWLKNNQGRGLFMYGNCGRGKTMLGRYVIPAILLKYSRKIVNCYDVGELDTKIDEALKLHILSIDDVGVDTVAVNYGKRRVPFAELIDASEKYGKLMIITSNLNAGDLIDRYGDRVIDRIKATCVRIPFVGESLRR